MGVIKLRTSQLDRSVRLSPHCAPDILGFRLAHVDIIMAGDDTSIGGSGRRKEAEKIESKGAKKKDTRKSPQEERNSSVRKNNPYIGQNSQ
jgi:hypothetical protein